MRDRVAAVHFTPAFGRLDENRAALARLARDAAERAGLVVLPELATTGFCLSAGEATMWAETIPGPTTEALSVVARETGTVIVVGVAASRGRDLVNAQVVIDADGRVAGTYAKHHLWGADFEWATPGEGAGAVVATARGRVGLLVCHDIVYPRTVLEVARLRPDVVAFSTAWVGGGEPFPEAWALASTLLGDARLVAANRGGAERGTRFDDPSAILRRGQVLRRGAAGAHPQVLVDD